MNKYFLTTLSAVVLAAGTVLAAETTTTEVNGSITVNPPAGSISALNGAPTGAYGSSRVETKLNVDIKENTKEVHFIRDNNDPKVVTKAYVIKNADPFNLRGVLKTIVSGTIKDNPVGIESIKYVDGTGVLMVSAEEYRFKDVGNGMSMDQVIASLDKKDLPNSSGTTDMAYFPKYNSAETLMHMMKISNIGHTGGNLTSNEYTYNKDGLMVEAMFYAHVDTAMNALIMSAPGYNIADVMKFLKEIDTPKGEILLSYKLVEVYAENDQKLGLDFQAWKNNDGIDFFSVGGKYGTNWSTSGMVSQLTPNNGPRLTQFYNFNPKWNTKYLDFLTTCGKAKIVSSGSLCVDDGGSSSFLASEGMFTIIAKKIENKSVQNTLPTPKKDGMQSQSDPDRGNYARLYDQIQTVSQEVLTGHTIYKGRTQETEASDQSNIFRLTLAGNVRNKASTLKVSLESVSLIGWDGEGKARLSNSTYDTTIQIGNGKQEFVVGGITKSSVVRSVSGIPLLKDLPILGWVFSTETDTVKNSQFVLIATAEIVKTSDKIKADVKEEMNKINTSVQKGKESPLSVTGYQQYFLDPESTDFRK